MPGDDVTPVKQFARSNENFVSNYPSLSVQIVVYAVEHLLVDESPATKTFNPLLDVDVFDVLSFLFVESEIHLALPDWRRRNV